MKSKLWQLIERNAFCMALFCVIWIPALTWWQMNLDWVADAIKRCPVAVSWLCLLSLCLAILILCHTIQEVLAHYLDRKAKK